MTEKTAEKENAKSAPQLDPAAERLKLCEMLYGVYFAAIFMHMASMLMLYGIYAAPAFVQIILALLIVLSLSAVTAGIILAHMEVRKAALTLAGNHLHWLIRTFWIGAGVYLPVLTILSATTLLFVMNWEVLAESYSTGEKPALQQAIENLAQQNNTVMVTTMLLYTLPFAAWWVWRCWYGYRRLKDGKQIPNPESWL